VIDLLQIRCVPDAVFAVLVSHCLRMQALLSVIITASPHWLSTWDKCRRSCNVSAHSPWMSMSARDLGTGGKHSPHLRHSNVSTKAKVGTVSATSAGTLPVTLSYALRTGAQGSTVTILIISWTKPRRAIDASQAG